LRRRHEEGSAANVGVARDWNLVRQAAGEPKTFAARLRWRLTKFQCAKCSGTAALSTETTTENTVGAVRRSHESTAATEAVGSRPASRALRGEA
jgi:hypothetical protein